MQLLSGFFNLAHALAIAVGLLWFGYKVAEALF